MKYSEVLKIIYFRGKKLHVRYSNDFFVLLLKFFHSLSFNFSYNFSFVYHYTFDRIFFGYSCIKQGCIIDKCILYNSKNYFFISGVCSCYKSQTYSVTDQKTINIWLIGWVLKYKCWILQLTLFSGSKICDSWQIWEF